MNTKYRIYYGFVVQTDVIEAYAVFPIVAIESAERKKMLIFSGVFVG